VNGKTERLMVVTDSGYFFMQYTENPFFWIKYLVWLAIFFTFMGFIGWYSFSSGSGWSKNGKPKNNSPNFSLIPSEIS
jgi:hypothetical protein